MRKHVISEVLNWKLSVIITGAGIQSCRPISLERVFEATNLLAFKEHYFRDAQKIAEGRSIILKFDF
jgi:hypothetical protein